MTSKKTKFPSGFSITFSKLKIELKITKIKTKIAALMRFKMNKNFRANIFNKQTPFSSLLNSF